MRVPAPRRPHAPRVAAPRRLAALAPLATLALAGCASLPFLGGSSRFWGFLAPWDARSATSAVQHASQLDAVISGWIAFDTVTGRPFVLYPDSVRPRIVDETRPMAMVTTAIGGAFHPDVIRRLAASDSLLSLAAATIADWASGNGYHGLVIDFEQMHPVDLPLLVHVVRAIGDSARAHDVSPVVMAIPATDTAGYPGTALVGPADLLLVMLYDEHWLTSPPGPIASPDWVQRNLAVRVSEVGASRLVAGFPLYGYEWTPGPPADVLSYADAVRITTASGDSLVRDPASRTLTAVSPGRWVIWVSDATLLRTLVARARDLGVDTYALWRLGEEDPSVWGSAVK